MHDFFVPLLETAAAGCTVSAMPEAIRTQSNCIPLALARLTSAVEVAESQVAAVRASAAAETGLLSSSLYWCHHTTSKSRVQAYTWCMQRWQAKHCIAVVTDNTGACTVFDGDRCFMVS